MIQQSVSDLVSRARAAGGNRQSKGGEQGTELEQFREDFKFVLRRWRETGVLSEAEYENEYGVMAAAIRDHASDNDWTAACASHFAQMAGDMRRDMDRSERIKAEMQAERGEAGRVAA